MGYKQGDPINDQRYSVWCETPEEAYRAIRDALFRPTIEMSSAQANMKELISVKVRVPFKTKKSYLTIQCEHIEQPWVESGGQYVRIKSDPYHQSSKYKKKREIIYYVEKPADLNKEISGIRPLSELKEEPPGTFHIQLTNHSESEVTVKVQLQVTDDGDFVIPYEPVFDDAGEVHWISRKEPFLNTSSVSS